MTHGIGVGSIKKERLQWEEWDFSADGMTHVQVYIINLICSISEKNPDVLKFVGQAAIVFFLVFLCAGIHYQFNMLQLI